MREREVEREEMRERRKREENICKKLTCHDDKKLTDK